MQKKLLLIVAIVILLAVSVQASVEEEFFVLMNEERTSLGLSPVSISEQLTSAAVKHSRDMSEGSFLSHLSSDGRSFVERIVAEGYSYLSLAENVAYHSGEVDVEKVFLLWKNSPGHYKNMISASIDEGGLGVYTSGGRTYYTLDLGKRRGGIPDPLPDDPEEEPVPEVPDESEEPTPPTPVPEKPVPELPKPVPEDPQEEPLPEDRVAPRIYRAEPRRGFTSGDFSVEFREENPASIVWHIGSVEHVVDPSSCSEERGRTSCVTEIDVASFEGEELTYHVEVIDVAGKSDTSRDATVYVDTTAPVVNDLTIAFDRRKMEVRMSVVEPFFDEVKYIDWSDKHPRERRICSYLRDGECSARRMFSVGEHNVSFYVADEAENVNVQNVLFSCDRVSCK